MEMTQFLRFAVGLATALNRLHKRGLIHKDIKPPNVLVNSATGEVWLMGFGIASRLPCEHQWPEPPEFIAGTLPYMAPEQTGTTLHPDSMLGVSLPQNDASVSAARWQRFAQKMGKHFKKIDKRTVELFRSLAGQYSRTAKCCGEVGYCEF
jgi:serine/threonine protein kinase